jgi:hypothetical protein
LLFACETSCVGSESFRDRAQADSSFWRGRGPGIQAGQDHLERVQAKFPLDLLVRTLRTIARRVAWNDFFLKEILCKGKVLYDAARS